MNSSEASSLVTRYVIVLIVGILNLLLGTYGIFYIIFTPLTVYPSYWVFKILYGATLISQNVIFFKGYYATIIPACVAGSAYYLLLILNLTTPMNLGKRVLNLLYLFITFLVLNTVRIVIFGTLLFKGYQYFDITHITVWYFGSTLLVVLIWFSSVWIFKIKKIPIYTDLSMLSKEAKKPQKI